ncbi:MAG: glycosyltransferase [Flavobacteriaceae bacterium]|nr:glycosyltransferase family 2 protein [Bacteroidia bacterium]NNK83920.1 glycosyltransferase [Flavobacteriaceae bacterium]
MLSILIPTYNYNILPLAQELEAQALKQNIKFELICIDDGSFSHLNIENQKINSLTNSKFIENIKNIGRSKIRNKLISKAKYDYILLIDADMHIPNKEYILNYLKIIDKNLDVAFGGIKYFDSPPKSEFLLRWKYGKQNESLNKEKRSKEPYRSTLSSNLLIKKSIAQNVLYESSLINYGYEDLLFAFNLKTKSIKIKHIENPLVHKDETSNSEFLEKTKLALNNLKLIIEKKLIDREFSPIGNLYYYLSKLSIDYFFAKLFSKYNTYMEKKLISSNPSLNIFKVYKFTYFCFIQRK